MKYGSHFRVCGDFIVSNQKTDAQAFGKSVFVKADLRFKCLRQGVKCVPFRVS